jgi:hypothetical protein
LHAQLGTRGVAAKGFVAEDFEEVDEADLHMPVSRRLARGGAVVRGTHTVRQVCDEILDFDVSLLQLAVEPVRRRVSTEPHGCEHKGNCGGAHHLVKVFCWTLTHCCSSGAMSGCVHQARLVQGACG